MNVAGVMFIALMRIRVVWRSAGNRFVQHHSTFIARDEVTEMRMMSRRDREDIARIMEVMRVRGWYEERRNASRR